MSEAFMSSMKRTDSYSKYINPTDQQDEEINSIDGLAMFSADQTMMSQVFPVPRSHYNLISIKSKT